MIVLILYSLKFIFFFFLMWSPHFNVTAFQQRFKKSCSRPMNRFNSLKYGQHFNAHISKRKEKKKKNIQKTTFRNVCNITKYFEKLTSAT